MPPHDTVDNLSQAMMHGGETAFDIVPMLLAKVISKRLWSERTDRDGKPFRSFEAFTSHRRWQGLESSIDDLLAYCRKRDDVQQLIKAEVEPERAHGRPSKEEASKGDNVTFNDRGNGSTYTLKRLKRDAPELFEKVVTGEISANAAAIEAGFREKTISVPLNVEKAARAIKRHFSQSECAELIRLLDRNA